MRTLAAFAIGAALTALLLPTHDTVETIVVTQYEQVGIDPVEVLDRLQDLSNIDPNLSDQLYVECIKYLEQQTDDPIAGIAIHVERRWQSDPCAAADNFVSHGWY